MILEMDRLDLLLFNDYILVVVDRLRLIEAIVRDLFNILMVMMLEVMLYREVTGAMMLWSFVKVIDWAFVVIFNHFMAVVMLGWLKMLNHFVVLVTMHWFDILNLMKCRFDVLYLMHWSDVLDLMVLRYDVLDIVADVTMLNWVFCHFTIDVMTKISLEVRTHFMSMEMHWLNVMLFIVVMVRHVVSILFVIAIIVEQLML